jgi:transcriptional regulator with XRE-family HTH domain
MDQEKYTSYLLAFGQRMREIRKEKKMTLIDLEVETGISNGKLSKIENGLVNVEFFTIVKIAEGLGAQIREFFDHI